jgi:hypothetical protein
LEELALPIFKLNTITNFSNLIFCCWNLTFVFVCFQRRQETVFFCVFWQVWESPFSTSKMIFNVLTIKRRREIRFCWNELQYEIAVCDFQITGHHISLIDENMTFPAENEKIQLNQKLEISQLYWVDIFIRILY